jgi:SOS-response transcriptional repressor LexA
MKWNDRLAALVKQKGLSKAELSRMSRVPYDSVNKYLRGEVENPRGDTLDKLAAALGTTSLHLREGLTNRQPIPVQGIPFRGVVAAGVWSELGEGISEPEEWLAFNPVPHFPEGAVYCLTVQGDSVDKIAPHGFILVVVDLDISGVTIRDGDLVIVERTRHQGGLIETTAKRYRSVPGGAELYPESTNPRWQPIFIRKNKSDGDETVRIIARVEYVMNRP